MDVMLRKRHLRLWIVIGPLLVICVVTLLVLRPTPVGIERAPVVRTGPGAGP